MILSGRSGGSKLKLYQYDDFNRLIQYNDGATEAKYTYSTNNLRNAKTVNGNKTEYVWNGQNLASETTNDVTTVYTYDITGVITSKTDNDSVTRYVKDPHGNVTETSKNNSVFGEYDYTAFGIQRKNTDTSNPFRYCGEYYDTESDSVYLRNRYYNPSTGRFLTEDPIKDGLNWYSYCAYDSINAWDPWGLRLILKGTGDEVQAIWQTIKEFSHDNLVLTQIKDYYGNLTDEYEVTVSEERSGGCNVGTELIRRIVYDDTTITTQIGVKNSHENGLVTFNPNANPSILTINPYTGNMVDKTRPAFIGLAHEFIHAERYLAGVTLNGSTEYQYVRERRWYTFGGITTYNNIYSYQNAPKEELATVGIGGYNQYGDITENMIRAEHGLWLRGAY